MEKGRESLNIDKADIEFLKKLRRKKGGSVLEIKEKGARRELTDAEKVRASKLLYSLTMRLFANKLGKMSKQRQFTEKNKLKKIANDSDKQAQLLTRI